METSNYTPKMNARNQAFADKIRAFSKEFSIVGVVDVTGLPAPQFQRIRGSLKLKSGAEVLIVKKNLIELVLGELESERPGITELLNGVVGVVGLIFTNDNPFTLYKTVNKNKSSAPAKGGQIAPNDIVVPAGPTSFAPGPIIGELGALKIKAGINAGKVEIKQDSTVAKEGDVMTAELAAILTRLGIEPMEVGLNIKALHEAGTVYRKDVLDVDEEAILADIVSETQRCLQLSIGLGYYTKDNIEHFLGTAGKESLGLGVGVAWASQDTISRLISKAQAQMGGVASTLPAELQPAGLAAAPVAAAPVAEAAAEANEGKEEAKPADASAGLGSLF